MFVIWGALATTATTAGFLVVKTMEKTSSDLGGVSGLLHGGYVIQECRHWYCVLKVG